MTEMPEPITAELIDTIAEKFRSLPQVEPKKRPLTKQEAVAALSKEIEAIRKKGYTLAQISALMTEQGLPLSERALQLHLARTRPSKNSRRTAKSTSQPPKASDQPAKAAATPPTPPRVEEPAPQASSSFQPKPDTDDI